MDSEEKRTFSVRVDRAKCETAGVCVAQLPEVFQFESGSKKARVVMPVIPAELQGRCIEVAGKCPVGAIIVSGRGMVP
jgi:ferredoxin